MESYLLRLSGIYSAIDSEYNKALQYYGFGCEGCADNCCVTKFHHHTIAEELYFAEGFKKLDEDKKRAVISRAENVVKTHNSSPEDVRIMCPLNENGLCILYEYRPMICRIHGVPYELVKWDMTPQYGDGCYRFISEKKDMAKNFRINRTGFYIGMARLEKDLRESLGFSGRYRKTTAEMVLGIVYGEKGKL